MKYQLEYFPNRNCMDIHVDQRITREMIEAFDSPDWDAKKQPDFVRALFKVDGIKEITLHQYSIGLTKGYVYDWKIILRKVRKILKNLVAINKRSYQTKRPIRAS